MSAPVVLVEAERQIRERAAVAQRLSGLYAEEAYGLLWSLSSVTPLQWSTDPDRQARFLLGFNEGCEILRVARGAAATSPTEAA